MSYGDIYNDERAGKHSEQLTYRMTEYVITDEDGKLAEKWRGRKTFNLATESESVGELSYFFVYILSLKTIKLLFGG